MRFSWYPLLKLVFGYRAQREWPRMAHLSQVPMLVLHHFPLLKLVMSDLLVTDRCLEIQLAHLCLCGLFDISLSWFSILFMLYVQAVFSRVSRGPRDSRFC